MATLIRRHPGGTGGERAAATASIPIADDCHRDILDRILQISEVLRNVRDFSFSENLPRILQMIGGIFRVQRCALFLYSAQGGFINLSCEYAAPSMPTIASQGSSLPSEDLQMLGREMEDQGYFRIDDLSSLGPSNSAELEFYRRNRISSLIAVPTGVQGPGAGFLLLATASPRTWSPFEIKGIRLLGPMLSAELSREHSAELRAETMGNLEALMENLDDVLFILDPAGRILHANRAAVQCSGYSLSELRLRLFSDLLPPFLRARALKWLGQGSDAPASFYPLIDSSGQETPLEARLSRTRWSGQQVLLLLGRDITARMQALDGLKKHQSRSMAIINALPDTVLRLDDEGHFLEKWNLPEGRQDASSPIIRRLISAITPNISKTLRDGRMKILETRIPLEGDTLAWECRIIPFEGREVLVLARDISDAKMIEQMKSEFIDRISHDLRTPLTTAQLMVDLLKEGDEENADEYWTILSEELQRQNDLIGDLLTVSRLEKGRVDLNCVRMKAGPLIDSVVDRISAKVSEKKLRLNSAIHLKDGWIAGDRKALQRVLINLLDNALKFSNEGGEIGLEAREEEDQLLVRISDTGIGIDAEDLPRIYDRFYRSASAVKLGAPGCGVGLYLVKAIVEAHHGKISVESTPGQGAAFTIRIPLLQAQAPA